MGISQEELGRRLRAAREACRMTQEDVARHMGVSRPTVVQIESGRRAVTSLELDRLSYLLGRDIRDLLAESFEEEDVMAVLFRALPEVAQQEEAAEAVRRCLAVGRELTNLERLLEIDRDQGAAVAYQLRPPKTRWEAIQQGEKIAEEERRRLGLGSTPISDVGDLLESQGVRTAKEALPEDVSGVTLRSKEVGFFVVVNRGHHIMRCRFSLAHEYAHVLLDRDRIGTVSRSAERDNLIEIRANAFAADFLLPREGVEQFLAGLGKGRASRAHAEVYDETGEVVQVSARTTPESQTIQLYDVVLLAHHFGVSRLAGLYRLYNLKLLNQRDLERLKQEDADGVGRVVERFLDLPQPDHEEAREAFRRRFLGLALEAYRREEITRAKFTELAEMQNLSADDVTRLLSDADLADRPGAADVLLPGE